MRKATVIELVKDVNGSCNGGVSASLFIVQGYVCFGIPIRFSIHGCLLSLVLKRIIERRI